MPDSDEQRKEINHGNKIEFIVVEHGDDLLRISRPDPVIVEPGNERTGDVSVPWDIEDHGLYCGESTIGQGKGVFASGRGTKINDGSMRVVFPSIVSQAPQKKRHIEALAIIGYNRPRVGEPRERLLDNCRLLFIFSGEELVQDEASFRRNDHAHHEQCRGAGKPGCFDVEENNFFGGAKGQNIQARHPVAQKLPSISALESLHDRTGSLAPFFMGKQIEKGRIALFLKPSLPHRTDPVNQLQIPGNAGDSLLGLGNDPHELASHVFLYCNACA